MEQEDAEEYMEEKEDQEEKDDGYGGYIDHYGRNLEDGRE